MTARRQSGGVRGEKCREGGGRGRCVGMEEGEGIFREGGGIWLKCREGKEGRVLIFVK